MKLICPHCGLKGTADDALLDKKVRCPQCQKIFRLGDINALSEIAPFQEIAVTDLPEGVEQAVPDQSMPLEIPASQVVQQPGTVPAAEVGICSVCGFSLSHAYLEKKNEELFCRICLPA